MRLDVGELIDRQPLGAFHWRVFGLCAAVMLLDGYDLGALGFAVPSIAADWNVPAATFGLALSASLIGVAFGSLVAGWLGDRIGRRKSLLLMFFIGGVACLLTAWCTNVTELIACRFFTGIGMGGTIPNAIALVSEYAPRARRTFLVVLVYSCAALGSTLGSIAATHLIPTYGWRSVFVVGGLLPFVIAAICWRWLPESLQFLVVRNRVPGQARQLALRLEPSLRAVHELQLVSTRDSTSPRARIGDLFAGRLKIVTPLLWVTFIGTQAMVFFMGGWHSTLLTRAGHPLDLALRGLALVHFGGMVGGLLVSWLSDRARPELLLCLNYCAAVMTLLALSATVHSPGLTLVLSFMAGATVIGSSFCLGAFASSCYPPQLRATGIGAGLGIGRAGSITSPLLGGMAIAAGLATASILASLAIPAAVCAVAVLTLWLVRRRLKSSEGLAATTQ